jgi:predicted nucleotidyltransferase
LADHHLTQVVALTNSTNVFAEVYRNGTSQFEIEGQSFAVSTLPAIVLLKLIAYDDRPEIRSKDLNDIGNIVQQYHDIAGDDLFEDDFVDLLEIDILIIAAAQLLGRHIWLIVKRSSHLVERIMSILSNNNLSGLCTL